ncbi:MULTISPECIES: PAS domain-containing protein [unclassified Haloferax]|uniref:PAS domain-containing sensor histidine kinase n=1 Tax=unclassified Haloferax TaxID=2625095 RepID=UPI002876C512|nr:MULTISPECIES: PAS domain-containing protein [unclassified Haloferax]MDS0242406.1 PAS domain-containing protein [Haloferax sp. S2CR25]MDS0445527.1 PAS domain-containing protein [Haloferax sp. S2CR25-2]
MSPPSSGGTAAGAILYVAADGVVSDSVVSALRDAFERPVERAESAAAARAALADRSVSCLVAAADLPDGLELDALASPDDSPAGFPVVVYAAAGNEAFAARAASVGVDDYLVRDDADDSHAALVESVRSLSDRDEAGRRPETKSYRVIVEAMEDGAFVLDEDRRVEYVNPRIEEITGHASEALRGEQFESLVDAGLFPADEYERYRDAVSRVLSEGVTERLDVRFVDADGDPRLFELSLSPAGDGERVTGVVGIPRDVTDREVATTQRGELLERMTDAFFALDADWRFVYLNDRARDVFGEVREPDLGECIWDLLPSPAADTELYEKYHEAMRTQEPVTFETFSEPYDGWFEIRAYPSPSGLSVYFRDVTTRKRYLQALESTNQRLETVLQNLPVILSAFDAEGVFTMSEGAGLESLGREPGEVVGRSAFDLYDDTPAATDAIARGLSGEAVDTRIEYRGSIYDAWYRPVFDDDGEVSELLGVAIDVTNRARLEDGLRSLQAVTQDFILTESVEEVAALAADAVPELVTDAEAAVWLADDHGSLSPAASTAGQFDSEARTETSPGGFESETVTRVDAVAFDDRLLPPESDAASVLRVPLGSHGLLVVSTADAFLDADEDLLELLGSTVTSALSGTVREQELRNREADLAAANERLDDFVSIVAHDLRNPLAVATGYLDLGMESGEREHLERAANAVDRMSKLVDDLLDLARQRTPVLDATPVDLARVVDHAWRFVDTGDATLVREELFVVDGDDGRLLRLFENLFRNSVEHGSTGSRDSPDDAVEHGTPPDEPLTVRVGSLDDRTGFYVADNGAGIPENIRERVFDHGYTTTPRGTGYGLAIVDDIADAHGWSVSLGESAEGGARFEFVTQPVRAATGSAETDE